jgi:UDP-GlcNAc:undecaprenyl-phosphate GlcNAc-1-phosphate transferase
MDLLYLLFIACIAAVVSYPITNAVVSYAPRWGLLDRPDGHHKSQRQAVALGGGLAIFLGAAITFGVEFLSSSSLQESLSEEAPFLGGLLLACAWIVGLGLCDDRFGMKGSYKLVGQLVAALIVIASGLRIDAITLFGHTFELGLFAIPFTAFWLLGAINSLNLLDGIDGLATTIGIILCSTITIMALMIGQTSVAIVGAVFVGSLIGFYRFNYPPAVIYLGDAGSMLIGLVVGALAIGGTLKATATVGLAAPLAIWALPMFDSFMAILRRKLTGRSIYATDRGHLHHRLMDLFGKKTSVLAVVAVCCAVTCVGALLSMFMKNDLLALGAVASVLCMLIATQAFGHVEFMMLMSRAKTLLLQPFRRGAHSETSFQLQGSREWELLWRSITEFAEKKKLVNVNLDINLASIQEGFHASWARPSKSEKRERWWTEIPLFAAEHVVGRLTISGSRREGVSSCEAIDQLMEMLEPLEAEIVALALDRQEAIGPAVSPAASGPSLPSASSPDLSANGPSLAARPGDEPFKL